MIDKAQAIRQIQLHNRTRIARLRELAPTHQQVFFELLPLLFHTNNATLPAYVNKAPVGISGYKPRKSDLDAAKRFDPRFNHKHNTLRHYPFHGLYLINGNGYLDFPTQPQFECWLVHSELGEADLALLNTKVNAVCDWAKSFNIGLSVRLIEKQQLPAATAETDDLEQFYLNGLIYAGAYPVWWLIAPEEETDYLSAKEQFQSRHQSYLDFGPLTEKPSSLFVFNHCLKKVDQTLPLGLDSSLTLVYWQTAITKYPQLDWLSRQSKQLIYKQEPEPLNLDPNMLMFAFIKQYASDEQVLLAQQSLYIRAKERLSQSVDNPPFPWRRDFMIQLLEQWKWTAMTTSELDLRFQSRYQQCLSEYQQINDLLTLTKASLTKFAKQHELDVTSQFAQQSTTSQTQAWQTADVIEHLPEAYLPRTAEEHLFLHRFAPDGNWYIHDKKLESTNDKHLYQAKSLLAVLTWAVLNRLISASTRFKIADLANANNINIVLRLVQQLLSLPITANKPDEALRQGNQASLKQVLIFTNLTYVPQDNLSLQGLALSSLKSDPLNYAISKQSLIHNVEVLVQSDEQKWHYYAADGEIAPLDILAIILRWQPNKTLQLEFSWCPSENFGQIIAKRMLNLYQDVISHYVYHPNVGHYFVNVSNKVYCLQWQPEGKEISILSQTYTSADTLFHPADIFSPAKADYFLDPQGLLNYMFTHQSASHITLFMQVHTQSISLYLLDEIGNLFQQNFTGFTEATLLNHFYQFLSLIQQHNAITDIRFFRLNHIQDKWHISAMPSEQSQKTSYLPVTVELNDVSDNAPCIIYCGQQHFKGRASDPLLFEQVRSLVLSLRKSIRDYPIYITELQFNTSKAINTRHYLQQKKRLEQLLND